MYYFKLFFVENNIFKSKTETINQYDPISDIKDIYCKEYKQSIFSRFKIKLF